MLAGHGCDEFGRPGMRRVWPGIWGCSGLSCVDQAGSFRGMCGRRANGVRVGGGRWVARSPVLVTAHLPGDLSEHAEGTAGGYGDAVKLGAERLSDGPRRS